VSSDAYLSEDEQVLRDAAHSFVQSVNASRGRQLPDWRHHWTMLSEQRWPGVLLPAAEGGFGGSESDLLLLSRALGWGLMETPFLHSVAFATSLWVRVSDGELRQWGPRIASGAIRLVVAHQERARDPTGRHVDTTAHAANGGYVLNGTKYMVPYGVDADWLLVSARVGTDTLGIFLVSPRAQGVSATAYRLIDGSEAADYTFREVSLAAEVRLGRPDADLRARTEEAVLMATLAAIAEGLGCLEGALSLSIEHVQTRKQFGVPLASFQVLRHRIADMYIAIEELRSLVFAAAKTKDPLEQANAISAAKIHLGHAGVWAAEQAVQLHGAMGVTAECKVGQYLRRVTVLDRLFGGADHHIERLSAGMLAEMGGTAAAPMHSAQSERTS